VRSFRLNLRVVALSTRDCAISRPISPSRGFICCRLCAIYGLRACTLCISGERARARGHTSFHNTRCPRVVTFAAKRTPSPSAERRASGIYLPGDLPRDTHQIFPNLPTFLFPCCCCWQLIREIILAYQHECARCTLLCSSWSNGATLGARMHFSRLRDSVYRILYTA
jgi:hypothetical protein